MTPDQQNLAIAIYKFAIATVEIGIIAFAIHIIWRRDRS